MAEGNGSSTSWISGDRLDRLTATTVNVDRTAIRSLEADQARLERSAVMRMRATQASFEGSSLAFGQFEQGTLSKSTVGVVVARSVACDEVRTTILAAPVVRGEVHTWLDLRTAVAIGFGMVLGKAFLSAIRSIGRRSGE